MGRRRQAVLFVVGLLAVTTVVVGVAAEQTRPYAPESFEQRCVVTGYALYESSERPDDFDADRIARYDELTPTQRSIVDRALASEGETVPLEGTDEEAAIEDLQGKRAIVRDGTVYRDGTDVECQRIPGVPIALNPYLDPFVFLYFLFSGPLLSLVVLGVAGAVVYAVGEWARY